LGAFAALPAVFAVPLRPAMPAIDRFAIARSPEVGLHQERPAR
jgi:hypothetical protein